MHSETLSSSSDSLAKLSSMGASGQGILELMSIHVGEKGSMFAHDKPPNC